MKRLIAILLVAFPLFAQRNPENYTRVLLPAHQTVGTPFGWWQVSWWFRNDGATPADVFPLAARCGLPGPGPEVRIIEQPSLAPNETWLCNGGDTIPGNAVPPAIPIVSATPGAFLYVEREKLPQLTIRGWLQWVRVGGVFEQPAALRAIGEDEFVSGRRSVMPVPVTRNTRYALRLYALPETAEGARVTVRVYDMQPPNAFRIEEKLLSTHTLALAVPQASLLPCLDCDLPKVDYVPAGAQLFDFVPADAVTLRIEIEPASENVRWWALVSATKAGTNDVAVFQP